ncbi:MAG: hypothetical protein JWN70_6710 [Planctomycetaceae bacterium]|nr:hypothetical protein [Planctomycetaceae bacterium]
MNSLESTITAAGAAACLWDAVVIGAGPAGALTARQLADGGRRVLLLDAKTFPREKVCGGCINEQALSALTNVGLRKVIADLPAFPIREYDLRLRGRSVRIASQGGIAVSRADLDTAVVCEAIHSGADLLLGTTGRLVPRAANDWSPTSGQATEFREVQLEAAGAPLARVRGRVVVIADGLVRKSLQQTSELPVCTAANSWIGLHAVYSADQDSCPPGQVRMLIGRHGYVGTVQFQNNTINLAAAVAPDALRRCGTAAVLISELFESAGVAVPGGLAELSWVGTGPLTRRSRSVAGHRVMVIGDAAGYVEPFTGEGVGQAMTSAVQLADILLNAELANESAMSAAWNTCYRRNVAGRQWMCRGLSLALHRPWVAELAFQMALMCPYIPQFIANRLNTPLAGAPAS